MDHVRFHSCRPYIRASTDALIYTSMRSCIHCVYRCAIITADVNECQLFPNGFCSQVCVNMQGSFHCDCREGYRLFQPSFCTGMDGIFSMSTLFIKKTLQILMSVVKGLMNAVGVSPHRLAVSTRKGATDVHVTSMLCTI